MFSLESVRHSTSGKQKDVQPRKLTSVDDDSDHGDDVYLDIADDHVPLTPAPPPTSLPSSTQKRPAQKSKPQKFNTLPKHLRTCDDGGVHAPPTKSNLLNCSVRVVKVENMEEALAETAAETSTRRKSGRQPQKPHNVTSPYGLGRPKKSEVRVYPEKHKKKNERKTKEAKVPCGDETVKEGEKISDEDEKEGEEGREKETDKNNSENADTSKETDKNNSENVDTSSSSVAEGSGVQQEKGEMDGIPKKKRRRDRIVERKNSNLPFECVECGKAFATRHQCQSHLRTHDFSKKYQCSYCPAR
jgi:hypothetical protein